MLAAIAAAEANVASCFAALSHAEGEDNDLVQALKQAQGDLASLQLASSRQQCVDELANDSNGGGEAAALALDSLRASGVVPSRECFHAALAACARAESPESESGAPEGEWAVLLVDEAAAAGAADATAISFAMRACARSRAWGSAAQVLETALAHDCVPCAEELDALLLCCSGDARSGEEDAARLAREAAAELLALDPNYYAAAAPEGGGIGDQQNQQQEEVDGSSLSTSRALVALPAPLASSPAIDVVIEATLRGLLAAQLAAGPATSVLPAGGVAVRLSPPEVALARSRAAAGRAALVLDEALEEVSVEALLERIGGDLDDDDDDDNGDGDGAGSTGGGAMGVAPQPTWAALEATHVVPSWETIWREAQEPAATPPPTTTTTTTTTTAPALAPPPPPPPAPPLAMPAEMASALGARLGSKLGMELGVTAEGSEAWRLRAEDVEAWVRSECLAVWHADSAALETRRVAEEKAAAERKAAKADALARTVASAARLRQQRERRWVAKNDRLMMDAERQRRHKASVFEVALESMAVKAAQKSGVDVDGALEKRQSSAANAAAGEGKGGRRRQRAGVSGVSGGGGGGGGGGASKGVGSDGGSTPPPPAEAFLARDVSALDGVGPKRAEALRRAGLRTVGDIARLTPAQVEATASEHGVPRRALEGWVQIARHGSSSAT